MSMGRWMAGAALVTGATAVLVFASCVPGGSGSNLGASTGMTVSSYEQYFRHYEKEGLRLKHSAEQLGTEFKAEFDKSSYPLAHKKAEDGYELLETYFEDWVEAVVGGKPERVATSGEELRQQLAGYSESLKEPTETGGSRGAWIAVVAGIMQNQSTIAVVNKVGDWWKQRTVQIEAMESDFRSDMILDPWDTL